MREPVISIQGLGKSYQLGTRQRYHTLRDSLATLARRRQATKREMLWALRDVSFDVHRGHAVGVIGRNGAGKSTLLKILSRITEPTVGRVELRGRVGSLLEVGTGFHPELSGRENIALNGAILGMRRNEIERKLDDIIRFAEIDRFLDTPVKHYSSGMYVRLAFAVAAHLEPEVLIVDEVLAVGDAAFQKKCLGKLSEVAGGGDRTVLFVSHNMGAIKSLTDTVVWLDQGQVRRVGEPDSVVDEYLASSAVQTRGGHFGPEHMAKNRVVHPKYQGQLRIISATVCDASGAAAGVHEEGASICLEVGFDADVPTEGVELYVRVRNAEGQLLFTAFPGRLEGRVGPGRHVAAITFECGPLLPGLYQGDVVLLTQLPQDNVAGAFAFDLVPGKQDGAYRTTLFGGASAEGYSGIGLVRVRSAWVGLDRAKGA